jgi:predicted RNA-binding Zn-ribbon protein involved in translation (DUF1610 family)
VDLRNLECPACETSNQPVAIIDEVREYRCPSCGLVYYGPCGCAVDYTQEAKQPRPDYWQMRVPQPTDFGPGVHTSPGCS